MMTDFQEFPVDLQLFQHVLAHVHAPGLLIVGQQQGHHLRANLPHAEIIHQDQSHCLLIQSQLLSHHPDGQSAVASYQLLHLLDVVSIP